jgi:hypothetical protein
MMQLGNSARDAFNNDRAIHWCSQFAEVHALDFARVAQTLSHRMGRGTQRLRRLEEGNMIVTPGGWLTGDGGHAVMYTYERTGPATLSLIISNTGEGAEVRCACTESKLYPCPTAHDTNMLAQYHPCTPESFPKIKRRTSMRLDGIPLGRVAEEVGTVTEGHLA